MDISPPFFFAQKYRCCAKGVVFLLKYLVENENVVFFATNLFHKKY